MAQPAPGGSRAPTRPPRPSRARKCCGAGWVESSTSGAGNAMTRPRRREPLTAHYDRRVPNRFTRVPERPVPHLPRIVLPVVVLADVFMAAMASRPATGSLRRTWVTPGTLELCIVLTVVGLPLSLFLVRLNAALGV